MSAINAIHTNFVTTKHASALHLRAPYLTPNTPTNIKILMAAGKITKNEVTEAAEIAAELQESPESILKRGFGLCKHDWNLAKEAAMLIEDDRLTVDLALAGFEMASQKGLSLEAGLGYFGFGW